MVNAILILYGPVLCVAWVVLILCWQGRQIPRPAACRQCGCATGDGPGDLAQTCSGCKADLTKSSAVVYFRRERSTRLLVGVVVSSIAVAALSYGPLRESGGIFLELAEREDTSILDLTWMTHEAPISDNAGHSAATEELTETDDSVANNPIDASRALAWLALVSAVLFILVVVGSASFAYGLILFFRGRIAPHLPKCGRCNALLTRHVVAADAGCPDCGCAPLPTLAARTPAHLSGLFYMLSPFAVAFLLGIYVAVGVSLMSLW